MADASGESAHDTRASLPIFCIVVACPIVGPLQVGPGVLETNALPTRIFSPNELRSMERGIGIISRATATVVACRVPSQQGRKKT